jgi:anaerobic selenocysteine-containing dehydrogenase
VQGGRVVRWPATQDHPPTHGALCTKVSRYAERTYHPERVLTAAAPCRPQGQRPLRAVGWDEALDDIAAR